jgi:putative membrane protein insertion efficiency factor
MSVAKVAEHCCVGAIRAYQVAIAPVLPAACRFHPSCSEYAIEAVRKHGAWRGSVLAGKRILRCQPLCKGGYDPVP